jgi:hypothetical protein
MHDLPCHPKLRGNMSRPFLRPALKMLDRGTEFFGEGDKRARGTWLQNPIYSSTNPPDNSFQHIHHGTCQHGTWIKEMK